MGVGVDIDECLLKRITSLSQVSAEGAAVQRGLAEWVRIMSEYEQRRNEWCRQLGKVEHEVVALHLDRKLMKRALEVLRANPNFSGGNALVDCMLRNYVQRAALTVRKLLFDEDTRSLSLANLIAEIAQYPDAITRDWWVRPLEQADKYRYPRLRIKELNETFDAFAGPGGDCVDPGRLSGKLDGARKQAKKMRVISNKVFAHLNRNKLPTATYGELDEGIDAVGELYRSLHLLLTRNSIGDLVPVIRDNWERIFDEPWRTHGSIVR